ncbi:hypothetical protein [Rhodopseudomonas parapalustris]
MILAIDPGNIESAYVVLDDNLKPVHAMKVINCKLLALIYKTDFEQYSITDAAIEMVASYGMAVGKEVFETCVWIGRFSEAIRKQSGFVPKDIYRKEEKLNLCGNMKANDSNITQALIDRFASELPNRGKGTKKAPGWFYGFKKDIWQAYAVGVTYHDLYLKNGATKDV